MAAHPLPPPPPISTVLGPIVCPCSLRYDGLRAHQPKAPALCHVMDPSAVLHLTGSEGRVTRPLILHPTFCEAADCTFIGSRPPQFEPAASSSWVRAPIARCTAALQRPSAQPTVGALVGLPAIELHEPIPRSLARGRQLRSQRVLAKGHRRSGCGLWTGPRALIRQRGGNSETHK